MKIKITLLFSLFVGLLSAQQWENIGTPPFSGVYTSEQEMIILDNGHPVVAFEDSGNLGTIQIVKWNGSSWVSLPSLTPAMTPPITDLNLLTTDNTLYIGFGTQAGSGYEIYRLDGAAWTSLDDGALTSLLYTPGSVNLAISDQANDLTLSFNFFGGGSGDLPNVYIYDGTSWDTAYGDELMNNYLVDPVSGWEINPIESDLFYNGTNAYYYSIQTDPDLNAGDVDGNVSKVNANPELRLHKFDGSWNNLVFPANGVYIEEDPGKMTMAGNKAGGFPFIAYTTNLEGNQILHTQQMDGAGNYSALTNYSQNAMSLVSINMTLDNADLPYVAVIDGGTSNQNKVIHYNGTGWDQIGGDFVTGAIGEVDIEVFNTSNKIYVLYNSDSGAGIRTFNNSPTTITPITTNICQNAGLSEVVSDLNLTDQDHDSVYVVSVTSNNIAVVPNANITVTRTVAYLPTSNENHYKIEVTPLASQSGSVNLTVTYNDGFGDITKVISFNVNTLPTVDGGPDNVLCEGSNTTLSGSGAQTYAWSNGVTDGVSFNPGLAGTYNYTVIGTDNNGCLATDLVNVTVNPLPSFSITTSDITCFGNADGEIVISGLNNSNAYTVQYDYNVSPSGPIATSSNASGEITFNLLGDGDYTNFVISDDATGCTSLTDATTYTISEPTAISIIGESNQVHCAGASVTLNGNAFGGTGVLVYSWNNSVVDGTSFTPGIGSLPYTVTATDDNGCFTSDIVLNITVNTAPPVFTTSQNNPTTCGGIDGDITLIGLLPSTNYDISYNDGSVQGPTSMTSDASGNIVVSGLGAGSYSNIDVTNVNGCTTSIAGPVSLSDPGSPTINPIVSQTICANSDFSAVNFTGTAGATFTWTNDNTSIGLPASGTGDIAIFTGINTGNTPVTSSFTVTPSLGGCVGLNEFLTLTVNPMDDAGFSYSSASFCLNSSNPLPAAIATPAGTFSTSIVSGGPININGTTGEVDLTTSLVGVYDITYSTTGLCPNNSTVNVSINANPTITITQPTIQICNNANPLNMEGIAIPIGGEYVGAGFSNNAFDPNPLGIDGYGYAYNYTDGNGCSATDFGTIEILEIPTVSLNIINTSCGNNNGSAISTVIGGLAPYTYYWSNGTDGPEIANLTATTYYLNITDANGCYIMDVATIQSSSIDISTYAATDNVCAGENNGAIDLTVNGSTGPYTFYWSNGETTEDISNLYSGQYEVFVTDINGCMSTQTINIAEPAYMTGVITTNLPTSCGALDGSLSSSIQGGVPTYSYNWTNSLGTTIATTALVSNIGEGTYTLTTTDLLGCTNISQTQLSETGGPAIVLEQATSANCLVGDGSIDISITSVNTIQSINWSNSETTEDISDLTSGFYSVIVTDDNGCTGNFGITLDPEYPNYTEICMVTVDTNTNTNLVIWEKPITTDIDYFIVYRETSVAGQFLAVDTIQYEDESAFTDPVAYPQLRSWRYRLSVVNQCGIESTKSPAHKTIHITISQGTGGVYNINWDNYEGFIFPSYDIYRFTDLNGWELISSESTSTFSIVDTPPSEIGLDYLISVTPPSVCTSTKAQDHNASRSNTSSDAIIPPGGGGNTDGISESELENSILIYPNPSTSFFNVYLNVDINNLIVVNVYDMKGSIVQSFEVNKSEFVVQLKNFESGLYILEINTGNAVVRKQLIKR